MFLSLSAANPFIDADGLLNVGAAAALARKINTAAAKVEAANIETPKVVGVYYTAKPIPKRSDSSQKKGDHKYLGLRSAKIRVRKSVPKGAKPENVIKGTILAVVYEGLDNKPLEKEMNSFVRACGSHNTKGEKVSTKVKGEKAAIREANAAAFEDNVSELKEILIEAGLKATSFAESVSFMGQKSVLVKLPKGGVLSLGGSDLQKFNAAKRAASKAE